MFHVAARILFLALTITEVQGFAGIGPISLQRRCLTDGMAKCRAQRSSKGLLSSLRAEDVSISLERPLGIVFEEAVSGAEEGVVVASLVPGGNAEKDGRVFVGDKLIACSAVVMDDSNSALIGLGGGGAKTNWTRKMIPMGKASFQTVMGAIGSNSGRWGYSDVRITLRRTKDSIPRSTDTIERKGYEEDRQNKKDLPIGVLRKDEWS